MRPRARLRLTPGAAFRLVLLLGLFAAVLILALLTDTFDDLTPRQVRGWVREAGVWAPALYLCGFLVRPLTLVPLTFWLVAGGIAFGWTQAGALAFVGVNLGAAAVFLAARTLGRGFVLRFLARRPPRPRAPSSWGVRLVLSLQLFPFMHHDLLNVAAGCSRIPYGRFLLGSSLGTLPGIVLYTYAGSVVMAPGSPQFYAAFAALAALSALSLAASRRLRLREALARHRSERQVANGLSAAGPGAGIDPPAGVQVRREPPLLAAGGAGWSLGRGAGAPLAGQRPGSTRRPQEEMP